MTTFGTLIFVADLTSVLNRATSYASHLAGTSFLSIPHQVLPFHICGTIIFKLQKLRGFLLVVPVSLFLATAVNIDAKIETLDD